MQKGDEVRVPEQRKALRFIHDWAQWNGARPVIQYTAQLPPLPPRNGTDPGPGGRIKPIEGPWKPGTHELDKYLRDGEMSDESPFKKKKDAAAKAKSQ